MASSINISANCKEIAINFSLPLNTPTGQYTLKIESNGTTTTEEVSYITNYSIIKTVILDTVGVVVVSIVNSAGEVLVTKAAVATCQIDCCIAKLIESAINCTCKCDKCKEELDRAEKIFLLLQSAVYIAEATPNNIKDAQDKYAKASELCTEVCACGC
jgi:hypothetical protein